MSTNRKNTLSKIVYTPLTLILLIPAMYLLGTAYIASMQQSDDCSFVPLFVALGLSLGAAAVGVIFNLEFGNLYVRTGKRIFALLCAILDLAAVGISGLIGTVLLSDGAPAAMRAVFLVVVGACTACFIVNVVHLFKKKMNFDS